MTRDYKSLGRMGLVAASLLWGLSFVVLKNVLSSIPTLYILAIRFCCAALILLPVRAKVLKTLDKSYLIGGALMGAALLLAYVFQTYGLERTTPGKNAFLTAVYCVIVPFLYWLLIKKKPDKFNALAAAACIIGMGLISLDGSLSVGLGDALSIMCGVIFAVHIVVTAKYVENRDPVILAMLQFACAGLLALLCALIFETPPASVSAADVWSMVYLTVACTAGCLLLQIFGQKYTPPSQAAVIMTLEAVFGALSSIILLGETLTPRLAAGFALTFAAVIISETKLGFLTRRRTNEIL